MVLTSLLRAPVFTFILKVFLFNFPSIITISLCNNLDNPRVTLGLISVDIFSAKNWATFSCSVVCFWIFAGYCECYIMEVWILL